MTEQTRKMTRDVTVTITEVPGDQKFPYRASCYGFEGAGKTWVQAFDDMVLQMCRHEEDGKVLAR